MAENLYKPRVFISHSAKEPETRSLCKAIARALDPESFEVLWDSNLEGSSPWRSAIDEWIWRCDAAVLVLSVAATASKYVAYEATLLRQRWKHSGGQFLLLPVWCPGVTEQLLAEHMGALQLGEIQSSVKLDAWPPDAQTDDSAFDLKVNMLRNSLEQVRIRYRARNDFEDQLFKILNSQTPNDEALADIADAYGLPPLPSGAKRDQAAMLARHLLDLDDPLGPDRFEHLADGIDTLNAVLNDSKEKVPKIINLVAPFCWVPQEGAIALAALAAGPAGQRRAVWRRSWRISERMYLYRAYGTYLTTKLKIVDASNGAGGRLADILAHIQSCLAYKICHDRQAAPKRVQDKIRELAGLGVPVFLLIPEYPLDAETLSKICEEWPEVAVILHGRDLAPDAAGRKFPGIAFLEPPLAPEAEDEARTGYGDCMEVAGVSDEQLDSGETFF
jgi:hypothetical protein